MDNRVNRPRSKILLKKMSSKLAALSATACLALTGCADSTLEESQAKPRETQPWESVEIANFTTEQLIERLELLTHETIAAAENEAYTEYHYLEIAITPALETLEIQLQDNSEAVATIDQLKELAIKLHLAGHDGNVASGAGLASEIETKLAQLKTQI